MFSVCIPSCLSDYELNNWDYLFSNFHPTQIYVLGDLPDSKVVGRGVSISSYKDLPQDVSHVLLAPQVGRVISGKKDLMSFIHPVDCIYIVGGDNTYFKEGDFGEGKFPDHTVFIPTDNDMDMWACVAMGITLYDRKLKHG